MPPDVLLDAVFWIDAGIGTVTTVRPPAGYVTVTSTAPTVTLTSTKDAP
jgi:hypothetical protein